ncbi:MAG: radical SAM protein, partial [Armatimonadia bacterium]
GPIPSRRLGRSLGISPIPDKTCNYSCIYCMLGRTDHFTNERRDWFPLQDILAELDDALRTISPPPEHISIVGNGEPTLYLHLGELIAGVRERTDIPVAVITNGALLTEPDVRTALAAADVVLVSFNAPTEELFRRINRPCPGITLESTRAGLLAFARMARRGQLWVEMMVLEGINDSPEVLEQVRWVLRAVAPDRVFVDTPLRPPAEPFARPLTPEALERVEQALGGATGSGFDVGAFTLPLDTDPLETLVAICARHPMREDQVEELLANSGVDPLPVLAAMRADPRFRLEFYGGQTFFLARDAGT